MILGDPSLCSLTPFSHNCCRLGDSVLDAATIINLRELFFDTQFFEHGKFSDLHKIIINVRPGNIDEELHKSTAALDAIDSSGRSPLSWAAQRD